MCNELHVAYCHFVLLVTSNCCTIVDKGELECHTVAVLLRCCLAAHCDSHSCNFRACSDVGIVRIDVGMQVAQENKA